MSIQQERFLEIANAIREKTGENELIKPSAFAEKVHSVFEAGKTDEWGEFWENYQLGGKRTDYNRAFREWKLSIFKPKYDIKPKGGGGNTFGYFNLNVGGECDIAKRLEDCGVVLDTSGMTSFTEFMYYSHITRMPALSTVGASELSTMFYQNSKLHTIDQFILREDGSQTFHNATFYNDTALANIEIVGKIGSTANFQYCPLTKKSIESVVGALLDSASGKTLTLKKSAVQKAFETAEGVNDGNVSAEWETLAATKSNWTITLV